MVGLGFPYARSLALALGEAGNNSGAIGGNTDQPSAQIRCGILTNPRGGGNSHGCNRGWPAEEILMIHVINTRFKQRFWITIQGNYFTGKYFFVPQFVLKIIKSS